MKGAIFFSGKYGSTEQYAHWIGEATGLPAIDIKDPKADPAEYDYIILGSSIIYFKLTIRHWILANLPQLEGKAKLLFSVSGAGPSEKLERWVANSLPAKLGSQIEHVALAGKLDHTKVSRWVKMMLYIASVFNPDPQASKEERYGFDHMDKDSIQPIIEYIQQFQHRPMAVT